MIHRVQAVCAIAFVAFAVAACDAEKPIIVGTVERDRVELTAQFAEPIETIPVTEGQRVAAGTVVATQRTARYDAQHRQAVARRDQSDARLKELVRGPRQEQIREGIARQNAARARRDEAELEMHRLDDLLQRKFVSQSAVDAQRAVLRATTSDVDEATAALDALVTGTTKEELEQARQALAEADAHVAETAEILERLTQRAPMDAIVEALPYEEGETPAVGTPIAVLLRSGAPYARVYVPEPWRARLRPGDRVDVRVDGIDTPFRGQIRYVSADASFTPYFALTRDDRARLSFVSEINLTDADALTSGTPVEITLPGNGVGH